MQRIGRVQSGTGICHALHRIISQTDARGNVTNFSYDGAGRITQKTVAGTTTTYTCGTAGNGSGRLISEQTGDRTILHVIEIDMV